MKNFVFLFISFVILSNLGVANAGDRASRRGYDNLNDYLVHSDEAEEIMGGDFYGQRALERIFITRLSRREIDQSYYVPFLRSTLERCRDCILFFYSPKWGVRGWDSSITSFLNSNIGQINRSFRDRRSSAWYRKQRFANRKLRPGWHLIRTRIGGNSARIFNGRYSLGPREILSPAVVYVYAMLLSPKSFYGKYIMTSSRTDRRRNLVVVGKDSRQGLIVIDSLLFRPNTGWAVEIKPDSSMRRNVRPRSRRPERNNSNRNSRRFR